MNTPAPRRRRRSQTRSVRVRPTGTTTVLINDRFKDVPMSLRTDTSPEIRSELVARVRREIIAGSYDTSEKLEMALERLFHTIDGD